MRRLLPLLAAVPIAGLAALPTSSHAASPGSGTLSFTSPSLTWTNSQPMSGAAPAVTRISCQAPTTCDDYALTLNRGSNTGAYVSLTLTPSAGAGEEIIVYPPGCDTGPTSSCYQVDGTVVHFTGPQNGNYTIRVACTQCAAASYSLTATMVAQAPTPSIPGPFDQSFGWAVRQLPGVDASTQPSASGEPGIWINQKGHVVVNTFGPTIWISKDDGRSFSFANQTIDVGCPSGDADAVVSFDDAYYADNLCLAGGTNLTYTSRDGGATWNPGGQGLPSLAGAPDSDRQWYAPDPKNPGVVYFAYHDLQGPNINVWRSNDYGMTFTQGAPITVSNAPIFADASQGNTTSRPWVDPVDPNIVSMLYAYNDAATSATTPPNAPEFNLREFALARSTDGGATWTNSKAYDAGTTGGATNTVAHEFPQATMDSAGNLYVLFSEKIGGQTTTHIMMGVLPRGQTAFTKVVQVDQGNLGSNVFPWAAAGDPGMVDITWYGSPAVDNNDHNAQWSQMFSQTVNALSATPTFVQSRMSGPKPMHTADICLAGTLCLATGGNRNLSDFQGVAVDPCGYAQSVWDDDSAGGGVTMFGRQTAGRNIRPSLCPQTASAAGTPTTATTSAGTGLANTAMGAIQPGAASAIAVAAMAGAVGAMRRRRRS